MRGIYKSTFTIFHPPTFPGAYYHDDAKLSQGARCTFITSSRQTMAEVDATPTAPDAPPVVLSAGAAQALAAVAGRVLRTGCKRPRTARGLLTAAPDVAEEQARQAAANAEEKQRRKARKLFDEMARIVPDAATDAAREKQLRATATRGAVALFNAVARAQRGADNPVQRDKFMNMLKSDGATAGAGASWLKEDFLTSKARKQKNFDKVASDGEDDEEEEESEDEFGSDEEEDEEMEREMESEPEIESEVELEEESE